MSIPARLSIACYYTSQLLYSYFLMSLMVVYPHIMLLYSYFLARIEPPVFFLPVLFSNCLYYSTAGIEYQEFFLIFLFGFTGADKKNVKKSLFGF